jgi:hypothetical protein
LVFGEVSSRYEGHSLEMERVRQIVHGNRRAVHNAEHDIISVNTLSHHIHIEHMVLCPLEDRDDDLEKKDARRHVTTNRCPVILILHLVSGSNTVHET